MKSYKLITNEQICDLNISPRTCVEWVREAFLNKNKCILSPKISQKPTHDSFFNTMPCCLPELNTMGIKLVSRLPGNTPSLKSTITLFDMKSGDLVSLIEADWITAMRTGAVAALAAQTFVSGFEKASFAFVGLGEMARSTFRCLISILNPENVYDVWLLKYKDAAERFISEFAACSNIRFHIAENKEEIVRNTNVLFSCVTVMNDQFLPPDKYPKGYTLIPVHTKGFQDCDLVFDKIFGDDIEHERGFKNFNQFRSFSEIADVLKGEKQGRALADERIISYNVGIALHDIWFAAKIYNLI